MKFLTLMRFAVLTWGLPVAPLLLAAMLTMVMTVPEARAANNDDRTAAVVKLAGQHAKCLSKAVSRSIEKNGLAHAEMESAMCRNRLRKRLERLERVHQRKSVPLFSSEDITDSSPFPSLEAIESTTVQT